MRTKQTNKLSTKRQKIAVAEKLIKVFANHSEGEFQLYLNGEQWDVQTESITTDPIYCTNCAEYWENLQNSSCWQNLDTWGYSASKRAAADEKVAYCNENHQGKENRNNEDYHGIQYCGRKKCTYKFETKWSYEVKELEDYTDRVNQFYGNPNTITAVYDGNSICSTLNYDEYGGRDRLVENIEKVIPQGYYYDYGTHYSLYIASLD